MEFRNFEITDIGDKIILTQKTSDFNEEQIFLDKKQIPLFIDMIKSVLNEKNKIESTGYLSEVIFEQLGYPINILVDNPKDLATLQDDLGQRGFGIENSIADSNRIKYVFED